MFLPPYKRPWPLCNTHLETIWASLFRSVKQPLYRRERITTVDDDFLDLDWLQSGRKNLAVISHGLEGDSRRNYVVGMANHLSSKGWDVLAWNFRGCSGENNRQPRFTHNGATDDLDAVVRHALKAQCYGTISLIGFSMGGNLTLMYLGRDFDQVPPEVKTAVCFSVPCDLADASARLAEKRNTIYMRRFMHLMGQKIRAHAKNFPEHFPCADYHKLKTFEDFDGRYTAPLHGFRDARDYWTQCSSNRYLSNIQRPVWIINARNDSFLAASCSPDFKQHGNKNVTLVAPIHGGHCGFSTAGLNRPYWSEHVAAKLLSSFIPRP